MTTKNEGYPELRQRWNQLANLTLQELIDWCIERDLPPDRVRITQVGMKYLTPESNEERTRRLNFEREHRERTEAWERSTLARLKEKYE